MAGAATPGRAPLSMWAAGWRACADCFNPQILLWSLLPLLACLGVVAGLGWWYGEALVQAVQQALQQAVQSLMQTSGTRRWLDAEPLEAWLTQQAPVLVVAFALPLLLMLSLLLVAWWVTPAVARTVVAKRFPGLQEARGAAGWQSLAWTLLCTLAALLALLLSLPLWLVPPLVIVVPPLIWGWLICRILGFDVLALHASPNERRFVLRRRGWALLWMGMLCGLLAALPPMAWALTISQPDRAPGLALLSVLFYVALFVFATCWFAHLALTELHQLRHAAAAAASAPVGPAATGAASHPAMPADEPSLIRKEPQA